MPFPCGRCGINIPSSRPAFCSFCAGIMANVSSTGNGKGLTSEELRELLDRARGRYDENNDLAPWSEPVRDLWRDSWPPYTPPTTPPYIPVTPEPVLQISCVISYCKSKVFKSFAKHFIIEGSLGFITQINLCEFHYDFMSFEQEQALLKIKKDLEDKEKEKIEEEKINKTEYVRRIDF